MSQSKSKIIFGEELRYAVAKRTSIKWIAVGSDAVVITREQALALIKSGPHQGKLNGSGKLVHLRQIPAERLSAGDAWLNCFRTTEAPIIQPSSEWLSRMGYSRDSARF